MERLANKFAFCLFFRFRNMRRLLLKPWRQRDCPHLSPYCHMYYFVLKIYYTVLPPLPSNYTTKNISTQGFYLRSPRLRHQNSFAPAVKLSSRSARGRPAKRDAPSSTRLRDVPETSRLEVEVQEILMFSKCLSSEMAFENPSVIAIASIRHFCSSGTFCVTKYI